MSNRASATLGESFRYTFTCDRFSYSRAIICAKRSVTQEKQDLVIVSLSPQSRASLAAAFGLSPLETFKALTGFLKQLGVAYVLDLTDARDLALVEFAAEVRQRSYDKAQLPLIVSSCPGFVAYAGKILDLESFASYKCAP